MMSDAYRFEPVQDWEAILQRNFESKELDYKGPCAWERDDKKSRCEIVKDILAMANTKGGFIVVGVSETPTGFSFDGLSEDQCKSFETTRLNVFVQKYADPPINARIIKYESSGCNFVIIEVPRFPDTPHICQSNYEGVLASGRIYVRTDNNESAPIQKASDMRSLVERAVRNRGDQLLASFRAILTGSPQIAPGPSDREQAEGQIREARELCREVMPQDARDLGFRETVFQPIRFERLRFTLPDLENMAEAASVLYRGWPYLFYSERRPDRLLHREDSLEMQLNERETFQFWRLHQSGLLYVNDMFEEDGQREWRSERVLGTVPLACICAEAIQCLVDLYRGRLPDDETVRLYMRLHGVRGRTLALVRGSTYSKTPYECKADQIVYDKQHTLADWRAGVIPHAIDLLRHISQKFDAGDPSETEVVPLMQRLLTRQL